MTAESIEHKRQQLKQRLKAQADLLAQEVSELKDKDKINRKTQKCHALNDLANFPLTKQNIERIEKTYPLVSSGIFSHRTNELLKEAKVFVHAYGDEIQASYHRRSYRG